MGSTLRIRHDLCHRLRYRCLPGALGGTDMKMTKEEIERAGKVYGKLEEGTVKTYKAIEKGTVGAYKTIEKGTVEGYKAIEKTAVGTYKKIEDSFVEAFLKEDGETIEEAKRRINGQLEKKG